MLKIVINLKKTQWYQLINKFNLKKEKKFKKIILIYLLYMMNFLKLKIVKHNNIKNF